MESIVQLRLFGPVRVEQDGKAVAGLRSRKAVALLAYVAAQGKPLAREQLMELFWPDQPADRAQANLRWALNHLHTLLPGSLEVDRHSIRWGQTAQCDLHAFVQYLQQNTASTLAAAVELYRGEFMAGFALDSCPEFEIWLATERERWLQQMIQVLATLSNDPSDHRSALTYTRRWLELAPWHEEAHRRMMRLLAATGQRSAALQQYAVCQRVLAAELGVEPAAETAALYGRIRDDQLEERGGNDKVIVAPIHSVTLSPSHLVTLSVPHNLPRQLTPLVGRAQELVQIDERLADPSCTWLTLLGPGGIGKTHLAVAAAKAALPLFADGVWFVALASIAAADLLPATIAQTLGLTQSASGDPRTHLLEHLRDKQLLLVLDNFEHLLAGVDLVGEIVEGAPSVKVLVTSRERLKHQAEWVADVVGLDTPATDNEGDIASYGAVQLFVQTARRIQPAFALNRANAPFVSRICRMVGGMPLGIELAAAWVRSLTCAAIGEKLRHNLDFTSSAPHGLPDRHRTLRAVIESSWRLLSPEEQEVLARLSVFCGGFELPAAEQISDASATTLTRLVDKSLLYCDASGRYSLHELVRQFGAEQLHQRDQFAATNAAHSLYYATFVNQQGAALISPQPQAVLALLDRELDNVRAAWQWAVQMRQAGLIRTAARGLNLYYDYRTLLREARHAFQQAAEALAAAEPTVENEVALATALAHYGLYLFRSNAPLLAEEVLQASLTLATRHNALEEMAYARYLLGYNAGGLQKFKEAEEHLLTGLRIAETCDDEVVMIKILYALGHHYYTQRQPQASFATLSRGLALARSLGDLRSVAHILYYFGGGSLVTGDYEQARRYYQESLQLFSELDVVWGIAQAQHGLLDVAYRLGEYAEARRLCEATLPIYEKMGAHTQALAEIRRIYAEIRNA